ncbi:AraC family transcriptional regulator [Burkholderia gladioli]|uniref:AraC family transcriptional regulator n=2 Tax=Burkholderia gladioli TaxID=28095 RepID=A0A2A7SGG5_BURGA|nr:AraC family transcriptional regulator [Burkholderia gladioli]MBU9425395.1 AraC family transcriptional regulator [Burkholderia gladioli]MDN8061082.1 AraC family transcriptional regulator [Burkholderia gladioli]PEH42608.1 AraC family transcriptional regulator [Burkholderia gladioli]QPQ86687.1 AraC family transcriptional regulator [Burkholderia gladioli]
MSVDPLAEVVSLLQPRAAFSKQVIASAPWAVRRAETGRPVYFVVLEGRCRLRVDGPGQDETITLEEGDFAMIPAARGFATSSLDREPPREGEPITTPIVPMPGGARVGDPHGAVDVRMLVGVCLFGSPDAALLVSLLPRWICVRGERRLSTLVQMIGDESRAERPAREIVLERLLEVLLIEALRSTSGTAASPGLVRGLGDPKLAAALRRLHEQPASRWSVAELAREAAMSRSAFFERFSREIGMAPMEYLQAWRMALAKQWLRQGELSMAEIAERSGYGSVSAFGAAFTRLAGMSPGRYARGEGEAAAGPS